MSKLALKLIQKAKETKTKKLDLGNCGLTELPDELFELVWLEELCLSNYGWFYNFEIKLEIFFQSQNKGTKNNIKYFSSKIQEMKQLKVLLANGDYSNRWYLNDLSFLKNLENLQQLNVERTEISDLSPLKNLRKLRQLDIFRSQVSNLSPLENLKNLQLLNVSNTQVSNLSFLKNLKNLQQLNVGETQISDLSPLKNLKKLQQLNVWRTEISDLSPLKNLKELQQLNIGETGISDLSPLKNLKELQQLNVRGTQINDLSSLEKLESLQYLNVSKTQVNDLSLLEKLESLQKLNINYIRVNDLRPLENLKNLQELTASNTQLSNISPLKKLENLQYLNISNTQISDLSPLKKLIEKGIPVKWSYYKRGIKVTNCPLTNPPIEIVKQGNEAILNYWKQIEDQGGTETINEAKLIIVGEGDTGKTTLFNKLIDPIFDLHKTPTDETQGINIHEGLEIEEGFLANLWDFGGQELQYMTHQFFLSPNAVYVLMMEARGEAPNLAYWFKVISLLGKDKSGGKVSLIIVLNKKKGSIGMPQYQDLLKIYQYKIGGKEKKYTKIDANKLIQLMSKNNFDICYKSESGKYVAAQLLPDDRPTNFKWHKKNTTALQFRYQYPIMPKGLMSRLIVRLSDDLEIIDGQEIVWKKGAILRMEIDGSICRVFMREEDGETKTGLRQIVIEVLEDNPPYRNRKYALQRVRKEIESLHKRWFNNINTEQIIPCNCTRCNDSDDPFTYGLTQLIKLKKGRAYCNAQEDFVPLQQLLEGVYEPNEIQSFAVGL